jgi:hypothetical protein
VRPSSILAAGALLCASILALPSLVGSATSSGLREARGTVVQSVLCGSPSARDEVRVELADGRVVPARLDGCGHRSGEVLTVEVPDPLPPGEVMVRVSGTGVPAGAVSGQGLGAAGAGLAALAGALLAWRLCGRHGASHRRVG